MVPALYLRFGRGREPEPRAELELLHRWAGVEAEEPAAVAAPDGNGGAQRRRRRREPRPGLLGAGVDVEEGR